MQLNFALANVNPFNINSIKAYKQAIQNIPVMSKEDEITTAKKVIEENCIQSAQALILSHLRFVAHVAKNYSGYGLPEEDLIQEGNIGLMKAVKRFDPHQDVRLVSFAVHWIKAEIHEYVIKNWRLVKIATTKAHRKLFFNLRKFKQSLSYLNTKQTHQLAENLNVRVADVKEMELRMSGADTPFETVDPDDDEFNPAMYLADPESDHAKDTTSQQAQGMLEDKLHTALKTLSEREQDIVGSRWLNDDKATLGELADKYHVSAERIRQLEKNAMNKLHSVLVPQR